MNQQKRAVIIDPAVKTPEIATLNRFLKQKEFEFGYHLPALVGMDSLRQENKPQAIVVLGSYSSVNDKLSWQKELIDWLTPHLKKGVPTLGICFGHQMISFLFGSSVDYLSASKVKREGFCEIELMPNRLISEFKKVDLMMSHNEIVMEVPQGFRVIGKSNDVTIEALEHETLPIWTFQAHPEANADFAKLRGQNFFPEQKYQAGNHIIEMFFRFAYGVN